MRLKLSTDTASARALMDDLSNRFSPKEIRDALMPAGRIYRASIMDEAPVLTGQLRKSVVVRKMRNGPVVIVAVDRKKALRTSDKFPKGFPYVNSVVSEKYRGAKADKFVARGADAAESAAGAQALSDLKRLARIRGLL